MKRIKGSSSTNLNETTFDSLKPIYGSKGNPPYYDPNDLHTHVWKKGKLGIEDNPKIPTYSNAKMTIKDCVYCKICHVIKDSFQSTISNNRDIVEDMITIPPDILSSDYKIIPANYVKSKIFMTDIAKIDTTKIDTTKIDTNKLFHKPTGIFDDYVTIGE